MIKQDDTAHALSPFTIMLPAELHPDSIKLLISTVESMGKKMRRTEVKRGMKTDWKNSDWKEKCLNDFLFHIDKGDVRDLLIYCSFMLHHGWDTTSLVKNVVEKVIQQNAIPEPNFNHALTFHNATTDSALGHDDAEDILEGLRAVFIALRDSKRVKNNEPELSNSP